MQAYGPLGSPGRLKKDISDPVVMEDPIITEMALRHRASPAQVYRSTGLLDHISTLTSLTLKHLKTSLATINIYVPLHTAFILTAQAKSTVLISCCDLIHTYTHSCRYAWHLLYNEVL